MSAFLFVLLLTLAVFWPAPVLWINRATLQLPLAVGNDSFLGREAPSWDVAFWAIAGLFLLAITHTRATALPSLPERLRQDLSVLRQGVAKRWGTVSWRRVILAFSLAAILVAGTWVWADAPLVALAEQFQTERSRSFSRYMNRLGGGMNPTLITTYFLVVGLLFNRSRFTQAGMCMILAGGLAGLLVQVAKALVGRGRPELWLGPFTSTTPGATSFPSGHTVGAFALATVAAFALRSTASRCFVMGLAIGVGIARILSFRHWPSDVLASVFIGTATGWFFGSSITADQQGIASAVNGSCNQKQSRNEPR